MSQLGDQLGFELPIIQAPMAGVQGARLAIAVTKAGGLGSLPCAMLSAEKISEAVSDIRAATDGPFNLNFFCHSEPVLDGRLEQFQAALSPYYKELGIEPPSTQPGGSRQPFNHELAELVEVLRPPVVSFHFGLPDESLVDRVKETGALIFSSATTLEEAKWLSANGADAVIAQGIEAGGHRGHFLSDDLTLQSPTEDLLPVIVENLECPVIVAGGLSTADDVSDLLSKGADCAQVGTAYLLCPEADTSALHRTALQDPSSETALTNLFTGRPARGIINRLMRELGPMNEQSPAFPLASSMVTPLRQAAEDKESSDFSPLWAGTRFAHCQSDNAAVVTRRLAGIG